MMTFVNLPVSDLGKATDFFSEVSFAFDPQFTDETATRMIISDDCSVMLRAEPTFEGFISPQGLADTSQTREVIVGLSAERREQVDELTDKALAAGAQALGEPEDQGFMYMRGFLDLDVATFMVGVCTGHLSGRRPTAIMFALVASWSQGNPNREPFRKS
jgi:predicted lactoylglutathione lyase